MNEVTDALDRRLANRRIQRAARQRQRDARQRMRGRRAAVHPGVPW